MKNYFLLFFLLTALAQGQITTTPSGGGGGSGTVTNTGGNLTSNALVLGAGATDSKVSTGIISDGTAKITLGLNTTTLGQIKLFGNTSGDATIQPAAVAGTATVVTLPNASSTLPIFPQQITYTGPTAARTITIPDANFTQARTDAANTFTGTQTFGAVVGTTWNGNTWATGTGTLSIAAGKTFTSSNTLTLAGTDSTTMTFPSTSATIARTDAANTFTGHQTIEGVTSTGATGTGLFVFSIAPALTGTVSLADATTPALSLASGKTNTGTITINGKTSGSLVLSTADATAQALTLKAAAQTSGAATVSIPDQAGVSSTLVTSPSAGPVSIAGPTAARVKTVRDAADTILELGGSYTPTGTWTNLQMVTPNVNTVASIPGNDFLSQASPPTVAASSVVGNNGTFRGGDATAGNTNAGAAAGGNAVLLAGDAKRLTSGNATGGDAQVKGGIGVGTGNAGSVTFFAGGSQRWRVDGVSPFHLLATTDNASDIGASAATRPRTGYFGTSVVAPTINATTAFTGPNAIINNGSTSSVSAGYAADTYLAGSNTVVAAGAIRATATYHCVFDMVKTAAGTATPIIQLRVGTAGTTSDTSRITWTFGAGTAAADTGQFEVWVVFRTVGSGTSAVVSGICKGDHNLATTGLFNNAADWVIVGTVSGGFDSSTATTVGLSFNGGASFSGTGTVVSATLTQ